MGRAAAGDSRGMHGHRLAWYAVAVTAGFTLLYLVTRSSILIGDAQGWIALTREGDPAQLHYGDPSHFLQFPLARGVWRLFEGLGLPISLDVIFVGMSLAGTIAASVFIGLIAAQLLRTPAAAWLAAMLFGTTLHSWTQWNGELYGLALGFLSAGLLLALRGRVVVPAILWALAVLSHSDLVMAAPAFIAAVWMNQHRVPGRWEKLRRAALLLGLAGTCTLVVMVAGSRAMGKWSDAPSFAQWLGRSSQSRHQDVAARPEVIRALKGLLTAYSAGGHYWRDILTGRGQHDRRFFALAAAAGLVVLVLTGALAAAAFGQRTLAVFALAWLLPFHMLVNWWFVPTVEKYHAGALPGLVLLVTGGLVFAGTRVPPRGRVLLHGGYVAMFALLNLFGAVLPMRALGIDTLRAEGELRRLVDERQGRAVFIACDNSKIIVGAQLTYLRLRSIWTGTVPEIQQRVITWAQDRLREGKEPYLLGRWCLPEEWKTTASKEPFDLFFLDRTFRLVPSGISGVPISETVPTNPFNWTTGDVIRIEPD
jgi:hypothetical protein